MSKEMLQPILAFAIGIIGVFSVVVSWVLLFGPDPADESSTILAYAVNYLTFGIIVGLLWHSKSIYGATWLALPLLLVGLASMLFAGIGWSFVTHDLPRLGVVFIAGTVGCYVGKRNRSFRAARELK